MIRDYLDAAKSRLSVEDVLTALMALTATDLLEDAGAVKMPAKQAFQRRVDVCERVVEPVGQPVHLAGEVLVVAGEDGQRSERLLVRGVYHLVVAALWVAEAAGRVVSAGRLEPVAGTEFAGIWGGATLEQWRGRGLYRALTAARARSAISMVESLVHSDSTEYSKPILERSGLTACGTSRTPSGWRKGCSRLVVANCQSRSLCGGAC